MKEIKEIEEIKRIKELEEREDMEEKEEMELDLIQLCKTQKISLNNRLFKHIPYVESFWHFILNLRI